jgi:hypothetical protein
VATDATRTLFVVVAVSFAVATPLSACKIGPAGRIAHDANKSAQVGKPYAYSADGMVHVSRTPSDSFWFAACGDDAKNGVTVEREGQVAFTPKEARTYRLCVEVRTAGGVDDTYEFDVTAAP